MNLKWAALILAAGLAGAGCGNANSGAAIGKPTVIPEDKVNWSADDAMHHDFPDAKVDSVLSVPQADGSTQYEFHIESGGKSTVATYGTFGNRVDK